MPALDYSTDIPKRHKLIKYYKAWIVYFVLMTALSVPGIITIPVFIEDTEFFDVKYQVINSIGLIGTYGIINNIPVGSPKIWTIIFAAELIMFVGYDVYHL
jgi:drug/metabolite transporter (DMT)-like permease